MFRTENRKQFSLHMYTCIYRIYKTLTDGVALCVFFVACKTEMLNKSPSVELLVYLWFLVMKTMPRKFVQLR